VRWVQRSHERFRAMESAPFTVFAPTDEAFSKLLAGTVESLLKPENKDKLKAILLYHVVSGDVTAADITILKKPPAISTSRNGTCMRRPVRWMRWC
jgi:uncharacterized surface protein with fasciclin (FAS1) repeats